jgi:hypothetical protein
MLSSWRFSSLNGKASSFCERGYRLGHQRHRS